MIPDDTIAEIRARADIVKVVGQHVQLRKAGRNFKGLCPFHGEKTPSFNVMPDKGFYYCFGCHKKGDAFAFVMEYEGRSFVEAAEQLAALCGVTIPRVEESPELRKLRSERAAMLDINKHAAEFYRGVLLSSRGAAGAAYLEGRNIARPIIDRFGLGYAPADWHALADYLRDQRLDLELAVKLGLLARQPRAGGYYDRFRDRLMCPVVVPGGEVVGFSARIIGQGDPEAPKYINSPESPVYKKSKLLFGLAQAREAMSARRRAVLVEGNFDVISLHQAGLTETVAPLGTALTAEQIDQLRRMADRVVLVYDGDRAGRAATRAALEMMVASDVAVSVVAMPDGDDPDSYSRVNGAEKLTQLIDRAQGGIEYFCFEVWGRSSQSADTKARALEDAVRVVAKVENPTKRDLILGTLATAMQLDGGVVRKALARALAGPQGGAASGGGARRAEAYGRGPQHDQPAHEASEPDSLAFSVEELHVIALLIDQPALIGAEVADKAISLLTDARLRDMYADACNGTPLVDVASQRLPPASLKHVLGATYAAVEHPKTQLESMISNLQHTRMEQTLGALKRQMAEAQRRGDRDLARQFAVEISNTRKQVV